jgi:hypothetical protein
MISPDAIGQTFQSEQSFLVSQESIDAFARVVGAESGSIAPTTYSFTIIIKAFEKTLQESGINWARMVHGDQRFEIVEPIWGGDRLTVATTIENVRQAAGNELVSVRADIYREGAVIIKAYSTLVVRGE